MSAVEKAKVERKRKPPARRSDIVIALIEERLDILESVSDVGQAPPHTFRIRELFDELKRSLGRKDESADSE